LTEELVVAFPLGPGVGPALAGVGGEDDGFAGAVGPRG
jgi:hypothetical protein